MRRVRSGAGWGAILLLGLLAVLRVVEHGAGPRAHAASTPTPRAPTPAAVGAARVAVPIPAPTATIQRKPEPPVPFGQVIYRAVKAAAFESLGVTVIVCRHRDPEPRQFMVEFFTERGEKVQSFGQHLAQAVAPGQKVTFVTDGMHFPKKDVLDVRLGHLTGGPARVISDARAVRCMGKIRFDGGVRIPSKWDGIGFMPAGVGATPGPMW